MGKYTGTLHKLVELACGSNDTPKKWDQVLLYLQGHTVPNNRAKKPEFESPLPPHVVPSPELECELFDPQGPKKEDTPLKIAITSAPSHVIAALVHLGSEAVSLLDTRLRLPIHWACRRSSDDPETDKVLRILITAYPESLVHRDDGGRTPLHWLFWYHAKTRTPSMVQHMCEDLPYDWFLDVRQPRGNDKEQYPLPEIPFPSEEKDIPQNAAIIADSRHGALALHYAVMQGANRETLKMLIQQYPRSIGVGDRRGRSALAWYLGAGSLMDGKKHICGEANDPNATPWWHTKLSLQYVQMLISSKVARMEDDRERTPLHWACHFFARNAAAGAAVSSQGGPSMSHKIFQILVDNNVAAVTHQDIEGKTPLHVMFSVVSTIQETEYQRLVANRSLRHEIDLTTGGPSAFQPPKHLIELLLKSPDVDGQDCSNEDDGHGFTAAWCEDDNGHLPLHAALRAATSFECIQMLIQANPASLLHTTEEQMQTPLVQAFCSEFSAPLQPAKILEILLAAYVTSRHGTFMDGRLALKMEDAHGKFPIHYACQNQASFETIKLFVEKFNRCAIFQNGDGDLPVHSLLSKNYLFDSSENGVVDGASLAQPLGLFSEQELNRQRQINEMLKLKMRILLEPLRLPEHLKIVSSAHGMTPLHIAVAFNALPYDRIYRMVDAYPEAAKMLTTQEGHTYSCLDLHEKLKEEVDDVEQWLGIRELLYAFNPSAETHRNDEELLEACVKLIRSEILGHGSFHYDQMIEHKLRAPISIDLTETLSAINAPQIDTARHPKNRRKNKPVIPPVTTKRKERKEESPVHAEDVEISVSGSFTSMLSKKLERKRLPKKNSIYDTDLDDRYVVSPQNSIDDEADADDFDDSSVEEEYYSEEGESETDEASNIERLESASWDDFAESASITESVSLTLSQTLSCVETMSHSRSRSLLRKAIAQSVSDDLKMKEILEEKKENDLDSSVPDYQIQVSEVAKRLWCFFVAYNNPKNANDNYLQQVEAVLEDVEFEIAEQLIDLAVPSFAVEYMSPGISPLGLTLRDIASPKVKALFESYYYFLGRFKFPTDLDGVVIHRTPDNNTVWVRAIEHVVQTSEFEPPKILDPGTAEETIWRTGEMVHDEPGYEASRFKDNKRQVYFKLTRNFGVFTNEVRCREDVGMNEQEVNSALFLPLLSYFDMTGDRKADRRYKLDVNDDRFRTIRLYGGEKLVLSDFPFALVYPYGEEGDLFEYFYHHGVDNFNEIAHISLQVARAVKVMHEHGIVHGNLSMRSVTMAPFDSDNPNPQRTWVLSDLSGACRNHQSSYLGAISSDGSAQFQTGLMPPEMFTKLSPQEEDLCQEYWRKVEELYSIRVDRRVVSPYVDSRTGCSYTLRCHYVPDGRKKVVEGDLPDLPYMLVPSRESVDLWCFGVMLFCMCSGGRPLFPTNIKSGHLLQHDGIVTWSKDVARMNVYDHVSNSIAQDILLQLLTTYESRNTLDMQSILAHPFFSRETTQKSISKMIETRQNDCAAYKRNKTIVVHERSEDDWLKSRSVVVYCWNFDMLRSFHYSSSEIIRRLTDKENIVPSTFILLPYKLSAKNRKGKLAPTTKKDVERAERMGVLLLSLAKACQFGAAVEHLIEKSGPNTKLDALFILDSIGLPAEFEVLKEEFTKTAADRIEAFRSDPMTAVIRLIERRYFELKTFFKDAGKSFLYLVDEYMGVPLVGPAYEPYPFEVSESALSKMLARVLPFMHCCSMVVRGASGSVSGIVRLIFEAAYPHVPPSWANAASGLQHILDEEMIRKEVLILHRAVSGIQRSKARRCLADDLMFLRDSCAKVDTKNDFATMKRVQCGGASLWTTDVETIQEECQNYDFQQALEIQAALETKLQSQENMINQLQEKIQWLSFRTELNLKVPNEPSFSTHSASVTQKMDNTSLYSTSVSSQSGAEQIDTNLAPSLSVSSSQSTPVAGGTCSHKYSNAIETPSSRNSTITATQVQQQKSEARKGNVPTTSTRPDNSKGSFFPDDEFTETGCKSPFSTTHTVTIPLEESTVESDGTRETYRDQMSLD